jgi:hypothetical protein
MSTATMAAMAIMNSVVLKPSFVSVKVRRSVGR